MVTSGWYDSLDSIGCFYHRNGRLAAYGLSRYTVSVDRCQAGEGETRRMRKALLIAVFGSACLASLQAQTPAPKPNVDKASAYYHYTLGHMYAEQASMFGNRGDFVNKAIENYKEAIKADPTAAMLSEELSDLYIQSGRLRDAQTDAEEVLKQNPNDLNAHRLLARIFTRLVGDGQQNKIDEAMLRRAIDQYQ